MTNPGDAGIRLALPEDVAHLPDIERRAGLLFKTYPGELGIPDEMYDMPNTEATFAAAQRAGHLWVANSGDEVVGFALVTEVGGCAHVEEMDVLPDHSGRGIGSALLRAVCEWAQTCGYPAVTLRTFRDVPWNAPFYARRGFQIVDSASLSPAHVDLEAAEQARGLRADLRVTMVWSPEVTRPSRR